MDNVLHLSVPEMFNSVLCCNWLICLTPKWLIIKEIGVMRVEYKCLY